jgi:cytochrome c-type biogenesis protein CcmH/NrfG
MVGKRFRVQLIVGVLTGALIVYFWLLASRAFILIGSGEPLAVALGIGVLLLPIIGVVLVVWELRFGWQAQNLARRLAAEDRLYDASQLPRRASGRIERDAADAHFEVIRTEVEAAPDDWRGWYRLAQAYDLSGDRKRARAAMRHAIELSSTVPGAPETR